MKNSEIVMINQSPFYKKEHHEGKDGRIPDARIPKQLEEDLINYFEGNGINKTDGIKQIIYEKMEKINTIGRTCFNNIELIMLLPKTNNLKELNDKSELIALYNTDSDFDESYDYNDGFEKRFKILFDMKEFCEDFFPMEHLNMMKECKVFGLYFGEMMDWDSFSAKLGQKYEDLDIDDCYFVRFPLNNYLDVNRQGQFQHRKYMWRHRGLYVFDEFGFRRYYLIMDWRYGGDGLISLDYEFIPLRDFVTIMKDSPYEDIHEAYDYILHTNHDKEEIKALIEENERTTDFLKRLLDKM